MNRLATLSKPLRFLFAIAFLVVAKGQAAVELGIDRLEQQGYASLGGKRVGLITNQTGVNSRGERTRVLLRKNVNLVALFTPEHGLDGTEKAGRYVASRRDPATGLIAHSLYGPTRKPTPEMLRGIEVLVYDMQDIGCRSYTFISTMARCMEAAGELGIEFMVLDRPNPLGGDRVEGPPLDPGMTSFVGQLPVPYVHGMTVGELARMTAAKGWISARPRLSVIEMRGWKRSMLWRETGLRWVQTSPNIPRADSCAYYVVTGLVGELAGLEIGVGSEAPFEICASKTLNAENLAAQMNRLRGPGLSFQPFRERGFEGVRLRIDPGTEGNLCAVALHLLSAVNASSQPDLFVRSPASKLDIFYKVYGSRSIRALLENETPIIRILDGWRRNNSRFESERGSYLLY
jgi:uncharacterized protein YbbC (DUF1343 family)